MDNRDRAVHPSGDSPKPSYELNEEELYLLVEDAFRR